MSELVLSIFIFKKLLQFHMQAAVRYAQIYVTHE